MIFVRLLAVFCKTKYDLKLRKCIYVEAFVEMPTISPYVTFWCQKLVNLSEIPIDLHLSYGKTFPMKL